MDFVTNISHLHHILLSISKQKDVICLVSTRKRNQYQLSLFIFLAFLFASSKITATFANEIINTTAMKVINLGAKNSVLNKYMSELRDSSIQQDRLRFRQNIVRIGHVEAYEASKLLDYSPKTINTPLAPCEMQTFDDDIVIGTVFRAGLPLHQGFLDVFDRAGNAFVSAYRYYLDKECTKVGVKIEYMATPSLEDKTLMLVDPMLATGESMELAYKAFITKGKPKRLIMACVIACKQGVDHLRRCFPDDDVVLICGNIDPILNDHKYIVPGLGDAGDLMYGDKL